MDGDEAIGTIRAINEAIRVVAEHQISRITPGRLANGLKRRQADLSTAEVLSQLEREIERPASQHMGGDLGPQ